MKRMVFLGGAHRGGKVITETALKELDSFDRVLIADPKEDRALELAQLWRNRGISAQGLQEPCEKAIENIEVDSVMLAIDTIQPMSKILEKKNLPTQWQLLARGLGTDGPVIGLSGTVTTGDTECRASSIKLINELSSFIEPQSSGSIRENPLNADRLFVQRKSVSEHSVRRLGILDREQTDLKGGTLNFFWGQKMYPMMVQDRPIKNRWSDTKEQVINAELPAGLRTSSDFAVATVGQKTVDFFLVETIKGRRAIRFHMPLVHILPTDSRGMKMSQEALGALAVSGLGFLSLASKIAAVAVVTD